MDSQVEAALVDVILEEVKAQRYTATEMQARTGIKSRSWQNYFRQRSRPVPIKAVYLIAEVLGTTGSSLMARAEERAASGMVPPPMTSAETAEHALSQVSPEAQQAIRDFKRADAIGSEGADDGPGSVAN